MVIETLGYGCILQDHEVTIINFINNLCCVYILFKLPNKLRLNLNLVV